MRPVATITAATCLRSYYVLSKVIISELFISAVDKRLFLCYFIPTRRQRPQIYETFIAEYAGIGLLKLYLCNVVTLTFSTILLRQ